jgi:hypothetical protein
MSQYLPEVAWSTIASNVTLGASAYRYYITVNPLDPNEPGASPMTVAINDWFIDFAGYPFLIEEVNGSVLTVYDILERGDGVISAYAPYANKLGYVYRPLNGAIILTQAQLRKLDSSAADIITPIEKGIIWKYRGIEIDALYGDSEVIETIAQESVDNITKLSLSPEFILRAEEDGWRGGKKYSLSLDGLLHNNLQGVQGTGLDDDYIHLDQDQIDALWTKDGLNITRDSAASLTGILSVDEIKSHTDALPLIKKDGNNVRFSTCILSDCVNDRVGIFTETPLYTVDINGTVRIGTLTGLIKGTTGVLSTATAGTDYENPLTFQHSLTRNINTINLVGDSSAPGNSKYYGTNSSGTKGYYDLPSSGGTPGGSDTYVQFNDGGSFGGDSGLTFNKTTDALTCAGVITGSNIETNATSLSTRLGMDSGKNEDESAARYNTFLGYRAGRSITTAEGNTYIGNDAGYSGNGIQSVYVGNQSGYTGSGSYNTFVGSFSGKSNTGSNSVFIGYYAGNSNTSGIRNTFIGNDSGRSNLTGGTNTYLGYYSGYNSTGGGNLFLGAYSGQYETGSDKLFIDNQTRTNEATARTSSMIYGVFNSTASSQELYLNSKLYCRYLTNAIKTDRVYYDSSTKELSYRSDAFAALTDGATVTWDCTTGLNKTLTTTRSSFTINITNMSNGMKGELLIFTTTSAVITVPSGYSKNYTNGDYPVVQQTIITFNATNLTATSGLSIEWSYDGTRFYYNVKTLRNESGD